MTSANTVTIACKHPSGLLLRLSRFEEVQEPVLGGGTRAIKRAFPSGQEIRVNGPAKPFGAEPTCETSGGYALTFGVPKDFWDEWKRQNEGSKLLAEHVVMAYEKAEVARDAAKDHKTVKTGLEPLNMATIRKDGVVRAADDRVPRPNSRNLNAITTNVNDE